MSMDTSDTAWQIMLESERFYDTGLSKTLRMMHKIRQLTRLNGEPMPIALYPGQKPLEPFIFQDGGEVLEKELGKLISMRA